MPNDYRTKKASASSSSQLKRQALQENIPIIIAYSEGSLSHEVTYPPDTPVSTVLKNAPGTVSALLERKLGMTEQVAIDPDTADWAGGKSHRLCAANRGADPSCSPPRVPTHHRWNNP